MVVAIDDRYVTLCLEKKYEGVLDANRGDRPTGLEYLEKIIQMIYVYVHKLKESEAAKILTIIQTEISLINRK